MSTQGESAGLRGAVKHLLLVRPGVPAVRVVAAAALLATCASRLALGFGSVNVRLEQPLTLLLALVVLGRAPDRVWSAATGPFSLAIAALVAWGAVISLFASPHLASSVTVLGVQSLNWMLLVSLVAAAPDLVPGSLQRLGTATVAVLAGAAVVVWLLGAATGWSLGLQKDSNYQGQAAYVTMTEANVLASLLVLWGLVALWRCSTDLSRWPVACVLLVPAGLLATDTRAAWATFALGVIVSALLLRGRVLRLAGALVVIGALAFGLIIVAGGSAGDALLNKVTHVSLTSGSGLQRATTDRTALDDLHGIHWVVGLGVNSFGQRHEEFTLPGSGVRGYIASLPLQVLYDTGVVGVTLLVLAGVFLLWACPPDGRRLAFVLLLAFVLTSAVTSAFTLGFPWVLAAIGVAGGDRERRARPAVAVRPGDRRRAQS